MNYAVIKNCDIANGFGVRVSLFVSGCTHHCKDCFNPETWNFNYGTPYTKETEDYIIQLLKADYIKGITLLGGEPMEEVNQKELVNLLRSIKTELPNKDIWCYTGYTYDTDLKQGGKAYYQYTDEILSYLDVLVDGEFKTDLKNLSLKFRGSSNQRVIDVKKSLKENKVVLYLE